MTNKRNIRQTLNPAFLKIKIARSDFEQFKTHFNTMYNNINAHESEEFHKILLIDFLKNTFYQDKHYINTSDRTDLVIRNTKEEHSPIGVMIEIKSPANQSEMLSCENLNKKALQELVLYYLRERISNKNIHLKQLIVTNLHEWFIFDAQEFETYFAKNKELIDLFINFENKNLSITKTEDFYKSIASSHIEAIKNDIEFTHFYLSDYQILLQNNNPEDDQKVIPLFKIFLPEHLLKLPFCNDSNTLNQEFYNELLHIIGLTEVKEQGKKLIKRKLPKERDVGSLLEQAINQVSNLNKINRLNDPEQFGEDFEEQLFAIGLELSITWINRVLFLKLLESQLLTYHKNNHAYSFLNQQKIKNFWDLNNLFFQVLACKPEQRNKTLKQKFSTVPYLNSSLFEPTELEHETFFISCLNSQETLPIFQATVLKDRQGKKQSGEIEILTYLFEFLDAYDFASESKEQIQEQNKVLISSSVLGLIFEKINGYQDGSFFTPSIITMYMSRETVRLAILQKFKEQKGWDCNTIKELDEKITDKKEANAIINSLKICDPAVGSGHFLVSVLNEIISVKSELNVLYDYDEGRLLKNIDYKIRVFNDELMVTVEDGDHSELFEYYPKNEERQRVQKTLFHEKQTLIENCLFGVDLNPNSVKICRLRLWIELLKNAYYNSSNQLETLPNIDINIQCGDSLMGRFPLDADLQSVLNSKNIVDYKNAFHLYQNTKNSEEKREMERFIEKLKQNCRIQGELFGIKNTKKNAFEWRFEFPEALDDEGNFSGFDLIIGNPPYIFSRNSKEKGLTQENKSHFYDNFKLAEYQVNLYPLFIELGHRLLKENGIFSYITPNNWLTINKNKKLREFVLNQSDIKIVNFHTQVFDNAAVDSAIVFFKKSDKNHNITLMEYMDSFKTIHISDTSIFLEQKDFLINIESFKHFGSIALINKIEENTIYLNSIAEVKAALVAYEVGKGYPVQTQRIKTERLFHSTIKLNDDYLKYFDGKDVCRYSTGWSGEYLKYGSHLAAPRNNFDLFSTKRILVRQIPSKPPYCINACLVEEVALNDRNSMNIINMKESPELILAVLNSRLISYWFVHKFGKMQRGTFPQFKINELAIFPMPKTFEPHHNELLELVEQIMSGKKTGIDTLELEQKVDQLVYQLYDLTEKEIELIEQAFIS